MIGGICALCYFDWYLSFVFGDIGGDPGWRAVWLGGLVCKFSMGDLGF